MSVPCVLVRVPDHQLDAALADPDEADALFAALEGGDDGDADPPFEWTDIGKSFDAIHFVLDPARRSGRMGEPTDGLGGRLIYGTHSRPDEWAEFYEPYGVEGYSRPADVQALVAAMAELDFAAALSAAAQSLAAAEADETVYAYGSDEYVQWGYGELRAFYKAAAFEGMAVITFIPEG